MSFDNAFRKLTDLQRRMAALDGEHAVRFDELFNDEFMLRNTDFDSVAAMFAASGYKIESADDFKAIPDEPWDDFIRNRTRFASWQEMKEAAAKAWASRQMGFE
jgi:hypothetical protein